MPQISKTTPKEAALILHKTDSQVLRNVLWHITMSALKMDTSADTAAVVYEQLGKLGIIVP